MPHTPGPWNYAQESFGRNDGYRIFAPTTVAGANRAVIAEIEPKPYLVAVREENARLMSASPDLLAALEAVLPRLKQLDGMLDENAARKEMARLPMVEIEQSERAIAKAKGVAAHDAGERGGR